MEYVRSNVHCFTYLFHSVMSGNHSLDTGT